MDEGAASSGSLYVALTVAGVFVVGVDGEWLIGASAIVSLAAALVVAVALVLPATSVAVTVKVRAPSSRPETSTPLTLYAPVPSAVPVAVTGSVAGLASSMLTLTPAPFSVAPAVPATAIESTFVLSIECVQVSTRGAAGSVVSFVRETVVAPETLPTPSVAVTEMCNAPSSNSAGEVRSPTTDQWPSAPAVVDLTRLCGVGLCESVNVTLTIAPLSAVPDTG